jgi:hypothetical protein
MIKVQPVMTKARGELKPMSTYEVTLRVGGEVLWLGRGFTKRYATICRNWHIGWFGLDLPLEEVPDEKCDRGGRSWTYWLPGPSPRQQRRTEWIMERKAYWDRKRAEKMQATRARQIQAQ